MPTPATTAVIVTYRSRATIGACMSALRAEHDAGTLECIVVDNASGDGTAELVRSEHPWALVIESGANLGFGRGNNLGFAHVRTPYVLFLNPDARLDEGALATLVQALESRPQAGIVGPAILNHGAVHQGISRFLTPGIVVRTALGRLGNAPAARTIVPGSAPERADWVCGAVLLARSELVRALGGFDPRFFLYFEEMDLCRRALALGFESWAVGTAQARHAAGESARASARPMYEHCIAEHYFESRLWYLRKHFGWLSAVATELAEVGLLAARALAKLVTRKPLGAELVRLRAPILRLPAAP